MVRSLILGAVLARASRRSPMLALLRTQLAIRRARSYASPKDVGRAGGEGRRAVVIRWQEDVSAQEGIILGRKVGGAGRTESFEPPTLNDTQPTCRMCR
jgi:hypothetical protein